MADNVARTRRWRAFFGSAAITGAAIMSANSAHAAPVASGVWSTPGAVLTIGGQRSRIELGTAEAAIDGPITADAQGRFKTKGEFQSYTPGPQRGDVPPLTRHAHIQGRVTADRLELTMHVEGESTMRRYVFKKGRQAKLIRMM
jgi:hypothetical protein